MSVNYGPGAMAGLYNPAYVLQSSGRCLFSRPDMSNGYINKETKHNELTGAYYNKIYPYYPNAKTYQERTKTPGNAPNLVRGDLIPQNIKFSRSYLGTGMISQRPTNNKIRY